MLVTDYLVMYLFGSAVSATVRIGGIIGNAGEYVAETREFHIHELYNTMFPTAQPNNLALLRLRLDVAFSRKYKSRVSSSEFTIVLMLMKYVI